MKYFQYTILPFFLLTLAAMGQTSPSADQNYVRQINYQTAMEQQEVEGLSDQDPLNNDKKIESIVYYDGLGRPKQSIAVRAGGSREDLVTPIQYDPLGRQPKDWLPFPTLDNNGEFIPLVTTPLLAYYYYEHPEYHPYTNNPYSEKRFEDSPLNRILEQGAPGSDWKVDSEEDTDHTIKFEYGFNTGSDLWKFSVSYEDGPQSPKIVLEGLYPQNTLVRNITKDENWQPADQWSGIVLEFQNKEGQIVMKRQTAKDANGQNYNSDTYYIYDGYGNLVYALSPKGASQIVSNGALVAGHQTVLDKLCYQYRYDDRNRLVWKKIPGKDPESIRYDSLDRPVLTQDGNLEASGKWLFTKYDALGRVVYTGIYSPPPGLEVGEDLPETTGAVYEARTSSPQTVGGKQLYYTNLAFPTNSAYLEVLTVNYYDDYVDYTVAGGTSLTPPTTVLGQNTTEHASVTTTTQGLPTVSWVKVLDSGTPGMWTTSVVTYDSRGRALQTDTYNQYLQSRDWNRSKLDLITGRVEESHASHSRTGQPTRAVHDYFTYDHMGRPLSHKQQIDSAPLQLIAQNEYDELGQLVRKNVGGETEFEGYTLTNAEATYDSTVFKSGIMDSWDSGAKTKGKVMGNGGIGFTISQEDKLLRAGLQLSTNMSISWTTGYDYALYFLNTDADSDGHKDMKVIKNGVEQATVYEYDEGDSFTIARAGTTVTFKKNGTTFYTITGQSATAGLLGKVGFKSPSAQVTGFDLFGGNIDKKLQEVDYAYNIRGWLTDINDIDPEPTGELGMADLFNFRINYNTVEGNATNDPLFNGNIAQTLWKTVNADSKLRGYAYSYDDLNRIKGAKTYKGTTLGNMAAAIDHDVDLINYDLNGNLLHLKRWGSNDNGTLHDVWDNLQYEYDGNRLTRVADAPGTSTLGSEGFSAQVNNPNAQYTYDANGNMDSDTNKGIKSIRYNHLNLPTIVRFEPGLTLTNSISYIYDATGVKLAKIANVNNVATTTQYDGGFVYSDMGSTSMKLQFISHPEGYVEPVAGTPGSVEGYDKEGDVSTSSTYRYVFQYKDHLGNVRLSYTDTNLDGNINPVTDIVEESNYYPFGLKQKGYNTNVSPSGNALAQKFKYNGIELEESLGLNIYEMDFRQYDPAIARWTSIDPITHFAMSPYQAFDNDPVVWADPSGADSIYNWDTGQYVINGNVVSHEEAMTYAQNGGNADGSNNNTPGIQLYEVGKFNNTLPNYDYSKSSEAFQIGSYSLTPYYKNGAIVAYGASRWNRLEYIIDAGSLGVFQENAFIFTTAANLFYINGYAPDENTIALSQGKLSGLGGMWKEALSSPEYYVYAATVIVGGMKVAVDEAAVASNIKRLRVPKNARENITIRRLSNGITLVEATSPARDIPGSNAVYRKWINHKGETIRMTKTTFAPDGSFVHQKIKF